MLKDLNFDGRVEFTNSIEDGVEFLNFIHDEEDSLVAADLVIAKYDAQ